MSQKSPANDNKIDELISVFCWGCIYHFLGRDDLSLALLKYKSGSNEFGFEKVLELVSELVCKYIEAIKSGRKSHKHLLRQLETIITKNILKSDLADLGELSKESASNEYIKEQSLKSESEIKELSEGYSRDPFKQIKPNEIRKITLASVLYMLRAHATLFGRDKTNRSFDNAKWALNDCFQAHQFLWRVYQHSSFCHHKFAIAGGDIKKTIDIELKKYNILTPDLNSFQNLVFPWESAFFVNLMFIFVDILRGNIYYQIEVFDNAEYYYKRALENFDNIFIKGKYKKALPGIVTESIIRARFECSKIEFDNGSLLQSLANQLTCIKYIIILKCPNPTKFSQLIDKIDRAIYFLNMEKDSLVWDKRIICRIFDFGNKKYLKKSKQYDKNVHDVLDYVIKGEFWHKNNIIIPKEILGSFYKPNLKRIKTSLDRKFQRLIAEIFARIGFTLLILRLDIKGNILLNNKYIYKWLEEFFTPPSIFKKNRSPIARYSRTIIAKKIGSKDEPLFGDSFDRQLALRIRESIIKNKPSKDCEYEEYLNLLDATTQNIGNLVTIPRRNQKLLMRQGYINTWNNGEYKRDPENKLVILRRWQSYNPKLPRPGGKSLKGGGYLLIWKGKGIAIDPGYDFIQNLYDEGFSIGDINAVIVSHSHPDHDDDLSTLLTMLHEWNEYQEKHGNSEKESRKLDLFLNESSFRKFTTWVHSEKNIIGRIIPLPQTTWDKDSKSQVIQTDGKHRIGPRRGKNTLIDLTYQEGYNLKLEIVPAWHDDVINCTGAIGIIFHLMTEIQEKTNGSKTKDINLKKMKTLCRLGYTGDTGAYGLIGKKDIEGSITRQYRECDVLIAHLGDARLREISSIIAEAEGLHSSIPIRDMLHDFFCKKSKTGVAWTFDESKLTLERVEQLFHLLTALHLIDDSMIENKLVIAEKYNNILPVIIRTMLEDTTKENGNNNSQMISENTLSNSIKVFLDGIKQSSRMNGDKIENRGISMLNHIKLEIKGDNIKGDSKHKQYTYKAAIYILLSVMCSSCEAPWYYDNHLGIKGIESLFTTMCKSSVQREGRKGIFIVGELPEELSSYRHRIARWLNTDIKLKKCMPKYSNGKKNIKPAVHAFTGDIGLHIRLEYKGKYDPRIRCDFCNFNNEIVHNQDGYHSANNIRETVLNALDSKMIYLCTKKDHHPEFSKDTYYLYLYRPEIKKI